MTRNALIASLSFLTLAACGTSPDSKNNNNNNGDPTVTGPWTEPGTVPENRNSKLKGKQTHDSAVSGGADVSAETATMVRVWSFDSGSAELVGEGDIEADGSFLVDIEEDRKHLVVETVTDSGTRVAATLDAAGGAKDETTTAAALDEETSLEVAVFEQLVADGHHPDDFDSNDLRSRLFLESALEIDAIAEQYGDAETEIEATADAMLAGWTAIHENGQARGYSMVDAEATMNATVDLMESFDMQSYNGLDTVNSTRTFLDARLVAMDDLGFSSERLAQDERSFELAFRAVLTSTLENNVRSRDYLEALVVTSARNEAHTSQHRTWELLGDLNLGATAQTQVEASTSAMVDAMYDAQTYADVTASADTWIGAMLDTDNGAMSHFDNGGILGIDLDLAAALDLAADVTTSIESSFDGSFDATANSFDEEAVGETVVQTWTDFDASVQNTVAAEDDFDDQPNLAADVLTETAGSFVFAAQ